MSSYNKVFLMGNLTSDPRIKFLPSQMQVAEFGLAVNRKYNKADGTPMEEVAFVDCTAFGRTAETISQYCTKGKPIFVEGRLKYDTWDDKQGGGKRSKITVVVENFQFLGRAGDGEGFPADDQAERGAPQGERKAWRGRRDESGGQHAGATANFVKAMGGGKAKAPPAEQPFGDEQHFNDQDIPFLWEGRRQAMV